MSRLARIVVAFGIVAALALPGVAATRTLRVAIKGVAFVPPELTARVGDRIAWENADIVPHTATSEEAGFDVEIASGQTGEAVLKRAGTFPYICRYHPNMTGRITVEP